MKCRKCHFENPADTHFCGKCGTQLPSPEEILDPQTETLSTPILELTRGSNFAGRYEVIEELGRGGMGRVYKVFDKKVREKIALKLLKPEIASDEKTIERFSNELKFARKIAHRNVCRMYDLSEEGNTQYITMEYVPGEDLKSTIRRMGQLTLVKAFSIAKQISEGLAEAHRLGVVHRDLKPSNIMIDIDGNARIMDFGIARSIKAKGITRAEVMIGTPEYMSPEQVEGKEVDQRSDIYSLGIILYEMLTGRVPFKGDTPLSTAVKHKSEMPNNPRKINTQIPDSLSRIILRCLEKKREKRYQNTEELLNELNEVKKELPTVESSVSEKKPITSREITVKFKLKEFILPAIVSFAIIILGVFGGKYLSEKTASILPEDMITVAVISFENQTGDNAYDYLQEAIPNLLITSLEQSKYIRVITWERMQDLLKQLGKENVKVTDRDLGFELCRLENIEAIVLGSFIKAGEMFATDVKVLDVETKSLLKSTGSRGEGVDSILKKQIDELSREISRGIGLSERKIKAGSLQIAEMATASIDAYNYFLRGREDYEKFYFDDARRFLEKAVELDPEFAMAYLYLVRAYGRLGNIAGMNEALGKLKKYGKKVTGREGLYIEATFARFIEKDNEKYFNILKEMAKKYPKEKRIRFDLAVCYQSQEMFNEAIDEFNKALELDPEFGYAMNHLAYLYSYMNDFEKALEYLKKYTSVSPSDANPFDSMGELYFRMGKLDKAIEKFKEALEVKPDFGAEWRIAYIYALKEDYNEAMKWIDRFISIASSERGKVEGYLWKGFYHYIMGELEQSLDTIDKVEKLAESVGDKDLIDFLLWMKLWICYDWEKIELFQKYFEIRLDFRAKNKLKSSILNTVVSNFYHGRVDLKKNRIESAKSRLAEMQSLLSRMDHEEKKALKPAYDYFLSEVLLAEGSVDKAVAVFKEIPRSEVTFLSTELVIQRNLPYINDFLARAFHKKGQTDKAIAEYERLIIFNPESMERRLIHPFSRFRLAELYEEKGRKAKAAEQYEKAIGIWKNADKELENVEDARRRLAALKGVVGTNQAFSINCSSMLQSYLVFSFIPK